MPTRYQLRKAKKRRKAFEQMQGRIMLLAAPEVTDSGCAECGGEWLDYSPPIVSHLPNCPGAERHREITMVLIAYKRDIL